MSAAQAALMRTAEQAAEEVRRKRALRRQKRAAMLAQLETLTGGEIVAVGLSGDMVPIIVVQKGRRRWQLEVCSDETGRGPGVLLGMDGR